MVKIPKKVDVEAFWKVLLELVTKADGRYTWPAADTIVAKVEKLEV
jgi:hypothetical protein